MRLSLELGMEEKVLPLPTWNTLTPVPAQSDIGAERHALGKCKQLAIFWMHFESV